MSNKVFVNRSVLRDEKHLGTSPRMLSVEQFCQAVGIGRTTFYKLAAENRIQACKIGRRTLVKAEVLESFIASLGG